MVYVIIYDISDDRCRYRLSKYLEGKGQRIQESAFECRLKDNEIKEIAPVLEKLIKDEDNGNIRIYPVCENCMQKSMGLGDVREIVGGKGYAIF